MVARWFIKVANWYKFISSSYLYIHRLNKYLLIYSGTNNSLWFNLFIFIPKYEFIFQLMFINDRLYSYQHTGFEHYIKHWKQLYSVHSAELLCLTFFSCGKNVLILTRESPIHNHRDWSINSSVEKQDQFFLSRLLYRKISANVLCAFIAPGDLSSFRTLTASKFITYSMNLNSFLPCTNLLLNPALKPLQTDKYFCQYLILPWYPFAI
jgi:hypothetical protein